MTIYYPTMFSKASLLGSWSDWSHVDWSRWHSSVSYFI